jgi:hypothetical protein
VSAREEAIRAHKTLLNGDKLSYFEERGISAETLKAAWVGYDGASGAFTYPCIARVGGLLGIHFKGEGVTRRGSVGSGGGAMPRNCRAKGMAKIRTIRLRLCRSVWTPSVTSNPAPLSFCAAGRRMPLVRGRQDTWRYPNRGRGSSNRPTLESLWASRS